MEFPQRFGKYTLLKHIATGGMADIYLAHMKSALGFEKEVVIKRLRAEHAVNPDLVGMFLDEARTAANLTHPNIAQIFDLGEVDGGYFIAMEYVRGVDLLRTCAHGIETNNYLPLHHAVRIMASVCDALAYAHEECTAAGVQLKVVHRDVSPTNILISYDGAVKLIDFGIAKAKTQATLTKVGQIKGKFGYMAPEQCRGETVDARTDIFAVGINLYEITLGRRLFQGASEVETIEKIEEAQVTAPIEVNGRFPQKLSSIIMRALAKEPASRFPDARQMQIALEEFLAGAGLRSTKGMMAAYMRRLFRTQITNENEELGGLRAQARSMPPTQVAPPELDDQTRPVQSLPEAVMAGAGAAKTQRVDGLPNALTGAADDAPTRQAMADPAALLASAPETSQSSQSESAEPSAALDDEPKRQVRANPAALAASAPDATRPAPADPAALQATAPVTEHAASPAVASFDAQEDPTRRVEFLAKQPVTRHEPSAPVEPMPGRQPIAQQSMGQPVVAQQSVAQQPIVRQPLGPPAARQPIEQPIQPLIAGNPQAWGGSAPSSVVVDPALSAPGLRPAFSDPPAPARVDQMNPWSALNSVSARPPRRRSRLDMPAHFAPPTEPNPNVMLDEDDLKIRKPRSYGGLIMLLLIAGGGFGLYTVMMRDAQSDRVRGNPNMTVAPPKLGAAESKGAEKPPPARAMLRLTSTPAGARVSVNGNMVSGVTPTAVQVEQGRPATVQMLLEGHLPVTERIAVNGPTAEASMTLQAGDVPTGKLDVQSEPKGADVWLDGQPVGQTPLQLDKVVSGGMRVLRLQLAGRYDHTVLFDMAPDGQGRVFVRLPTVIGERKMAAVHVESRPVGAEVIRITPNGNKPAGRTTGQAFVKINTPMGRPLSVQATKPKHAPALVDIDVKDPFYTVYTRLVPPTVHYGNLSVAGTRGLTVYLGSEELGKIPIRKEKYKAGSHKLVIVDEESRARHTQQIELKKNQALSLKISLKNGAFTVE